MRLPQVSDPRGLRSGLDHWVHWLDCAWVPSSPGEDDTSGTKDTNSGPHGLAVLPLRTVRPCLSHSPGDPHRPGDPHGPGDAPPHPHHPGTAQVLTLPNRP